jgi:hypothetical protein
MTSSEVVVVAIGLLVGYWMVSDYLSGNKPPGGQQGSDKPSGLDIDQELEKSGVPHWAVTLDISPTATVEEIRLAYKTQMSQYHPDKVAALGVEIRELAERKAKEINIAYKRAMKDHGVGEQFW